MLVNITLIPFFLGIVPNVSEDSYFDPEYLYELNKTKVEYEEFDNIILTRSTSTIIACHPLQAKILHCYLHDIRSVTKYQNWNEKNITNNLIQNREWFKMEFDNHGVQTACVKESSLKNPINLIPDIVSQFNMGINIKIHGFEEDIYLGVINEETPIGICKTTYDTAIIYRKKNASEQMDSNYQIRLLEDHFSDKDLHVHIAKNRKDCTFLPDFVNSLNGGKVTKYDHIIDLIDNKLKFITTLEVRSNPENSSGILMLRETTHLDLIDIRSRT